MKLVIIDKYAHNPLDELSDASSLAFTELFSETIAEICADSLNRFWCIDSVCVVSAKIIGRENKRKALPCYKNICSIFKSLGKSMLETTFVIAQSDRMMLPSELPIFEKVRILQPCFFADNEHKKVLCVIKGSALYDIACRKNPQSINELYNMLKNEKVKTTLFSVNGDFGSIDSPSGFKKYAIKVLNSELFDSIKEKQDGIFCADRIPTGKFIIIPPVYFGKNVQVETGAVIGPSVIIGDCCLVSESSRIENSILCSDVYVSKDCYINGALIGDGVSLRRNSAVLPDSVIGAQSLVGEGAVVEKASKLARSSFIGNDYDYFADNANDYSAKLLIDEQNPSPEDAAAIGRMFAEFTAGAETAVINDGSVSSYLLKNAFISGAAFNGARIVDCGEAALSQCVAAGAILNTDFSVFISSAQSRRFEFFDSFGRAFTRREICEMCSRTCKGNETKNTAEYPLHNSTWRSNYTDMIFENLVKLDNIKPFEIYCENNALSFVLSAFNEFTAHNFAGSVSFKVNKNSDRLTAFFEEMEFSHEKLLSIAALYELRSGSVIKLPWNAPSFLVEIKEFDGKISFCDSRTAFNEAWAFDAFFLAVKIIEALSETQQNLSELSQDIPEFFISEKSLEINVQPCKLNERADADMIYSDGVAHIKTQHGTAKIARDMYRNKLHIITEAVSSEFSEELTGEVMKIINDAALDNKCN